MAKKYHERDEKIGSNWRKAMMLQKRQDTELWRWQKGQNSAARVFKG